MANYLQHKAHDNIFIIFLRDGLVPYLRVTIARMKHNSLFEHEKTMVIYEESMGNPIEYQKFVETNKII